jgi:glycogen debranching enzyme
MDAKVDDWVVTPRRGKAVEINALWYNALSSWKQWANDLDDEPSAYRRHARAPATRSTALLVRAEGRYLYDVVDAEPASRPRHDDPKCRPNQVLAISLDHPVLDAESLAAGHARRLRPARDARRPADRWRLTIRTSNRATSAICARATAAYHQGTVWAGSSARSSTRG